MMSSAVIRLPAPGGCVSADDRLANERALRTHFITWLTGDSTNAHYLLELFDEALARMESGDRDPERARTAALRATARRAINAQLDALPRDRLAALGERILDLDHVGTILTSAHREEIRRAPARIRTFLEPLDDAAYCALLGAAEA